VRVQFAEELCQRLANPGIASKPLPSAKDLQQTAAASEQLQLGSTNRASVRGLEFSTGIEVKGHNGLGAWWSGCTWA